MVGEALAALVGLKCGLECGSVPLVIELDSKKNVIELINLAVESAQWMQRCMWLKFVLFCAFMGSLAASLSFDAYTCIHASEYAYTLNYFHLHSNILYSYKTKSN